MQLVELVETTRIGFDKLNQRVGRACSRPQIGFDKLNQRRPSVELVETTRRVRLRPR